MAKEILIADSDKSDQEKYQKIFETTHYHLIFSESGEDVLLRVKLFKPDLIIAGTDLSEKNGFELCEALKGDPEFRYIPFILLLSDFEEISEEEKKRLKPDGVLSKPLHAGEIRNLVSRLLEGMRAKGERIPGKEGGWDSFADMKKEGFLRDEHTEKGEEGVIDLVDVVEEAEPRMSINDFAVSGKEETYGEITSLESWGKLEEEEKFEIDEGFVLSLKEEEKEKEEVPLPLKKEVTPKQPLQEEELFEKIELKDIEDILDKVGQMELPSEMEAPLKRGVSVMEEAPEEAPSIGKEAEEELLGLEEFEALLKKGVEVEATEGEPLGEALQPFSAEAQQVEVPEEITPIEIPEKELEEFTEEKLEGLVEDAFEEVAEEEFPEELLEEALEEEKVEVTEELEEEEFEEAESEELEVIEEPTEEKFDLFEGLESPEVSKDEIRATEEQRREGTRRVEEVEAPAILKEVISPPSRRMEQEMGGVISERVRVMMEEFIAKHVPEMTKDIIGLTIERIEKMVKEVVPDLAAKMIEEEIKRLEKGEKV